MVIYHPHSPINPHGSRRKKAMEQTELATAPKTARKSPKCGSTAAQPQQDSTSATRQVRRSEAVRREGKNCSVLRKMRNKELGKVSNNLKISTH